LALVGLAAVVEVLTPGPAAVTMVRLVAPVPILLELVAEAFPKHRLLDSRRQVATNALRPRKLIFEVRIVVITRQQDDMIEIAVFVTNRAYVHFAFIQGRNLKLLHEFSCEKEPRILAG
jgi:hypothetical protein